MTPMFAARSNIGVITRQAWWAYGLLSLFVNLTAEPAMAADPIRLLAFGDSLTAGYNLPAGDAFPAKLEAALRARGYVVRVINAGVSGDTSAGGRARLDWTLADRPDYAVVELGANDALRGIDPKITAANLDAILSVLRQRGVKVLLAGMLAPRNMGAAYVREFDAIYPRLARTHDVPLYPFFLEGVALRRDLTQPDGMHPNAQGVEVVVRGILPAVERLIGPPPPAAREAP